MGIYCYGEQSERASEPFTLLKSVFHKAHLHLELTCSYIYWVYIPISAHGHTYSAVSGEIGGLVFLLKDTLINQVCSSGIVVRGRNESMWDDPGQLWSPC